MRGGKGWRWEGGEEGGGQERERRGGGKGKRRGEWWRVEREWERKRGKELTLPSKHSAKDPFSMYSYTKHGR
jgi:hypothetical protein